MKINYQSIYQKWGFTSNPFTTSPLTYDERGLSLCAGRKPEIESLISKLVTPPKSVTLEGPNGIGKTSLINIVSYGLIKAYRERGFGQLFILCQESFQLTDNVDVEVFLDTLYIRLAKTILDSADEIKKLGIPLEGLENIKNVISTYKLSSLSIGVAGFSAAESVALNSSQSFMRIGFRDVIRRWLSSMAGLGGHHVICAIDNLELVGTSTKAKRLLENLRDQALNIEGVRWILAGAEEIVQGAVTSSRLDGIIYHPVQIRGVDQETGGEIFDNRIEACKEDGGWFLPLNREDLQDLTVIFHGNIRYAISYADEYCNWFADNGFDRNTDTSNSKLMHWLKIAAESINKSFIDRSKPRAVQLFRSLGRQPNFSYENAGNLGFNSYQSMSQYTNQLENVGLIQSTRDDRDKRKKQFSLSAKGFLLGYMEYDFFR